MQFKIYNLNFLVFTCLPINFEIWKVYTLITFILILSVLYLISFNNIEILRQNPINDREKSKDKKSQGSSEKFPCPDLGGNSNQNANNENNETIESTEPLTHGESMGLAPDEDQRLSITINNILKFNKKERENQKKRKFK